MVKFPCTYNPGSNSRKSLRLKRMSWIVDRYCLIYDILEGVYPNFCEPRADFYGVWLPTKLFVLSLSLVLEEYLIDILFVILNILLYSQSIY